MDFYNILDYYFGVFVNGCVTVTVIVLVIVGGIALRQWGGRRLLLLTIIVLMGLLVVSLVRLRGSIILTRERSALAAELGVNLWEWPRPAAFPLGYFFSVLEQGMPQQEVHQIVRGYERVLRCGPDSRGYTREVYYFYSHRDDRALRMQIEYDTQGHMSRVQGEDQNSRRFYVDNCQPGRWDR